MSKPTKNLLIFVAATFVWTWAFYIPIAAGGHNAYQMPWTILLIFGGMGPSVMGILMVLFTLDKEARRDFWRRCFSFRRIGRLWWAIIFLMFPILYGSSILLDRAMGGSLPEVTQLRSLIANPLMIPLASFISFMSGPWPEEFGWRGYALDRIMTPLGLLAGTVVLGLNWGVWHLPLDGSVYDLESDSSDRSTFVVAFRLLRSLLFSERFSRTCHLHTNVAMILTGCACWACSCWCPFTPR